MGNLVMGYWDCPFCGSKGIAGTTVNCPSCGRARGDVKFYMKNVAEGQSREQHERGDIEYLDAEQAKYVSKNPDWYCSFCNSLNSDNAQFCGNCGASRADSESNYFDMRKKMEEREARNAAAAAPQEPQKKRNPLVFLLIAAALIVGLVMFLNGNKTSGDQRVTGLSWERIISVEKNVQYSESGWELPDGAEVTKTEKEIHHYESVVSGHTKQEVQRSKQVFDHNETYYTYTDNGNGTFTEVPHEREVYRTEYYTEIVSVPVYKQEPKYAKKYYYTIWRWKPDHDEKASGTDHEAYWPELSLGENEREGERREEYRFTVEDAKKKTSATYRLAEADWRNINVNDTLNITSKRTGSNPYISDEKGNRIADIEAVR